MIKTDGQFDIIYHPLLVSPEECEMSSVKYVTRCVELFLEYVKIDTQSNEDSDTFPSTAGQLVLLQRLHDELKALGLADVTKDEF